MKANKIITAGVLALSSVLLLEGVADNKISYFITAMNAMAVFFMFWEKNWAGSR